MSNPRPDPITVKGMTDAIEHPGTTLTADERQMAARVGMPEDRYAAMKNVRNLNDWTLTRGYQNPDAPRYSGPRQVDDAVDTEP